MKVDRATYCYWAKLTDHDPNNCRQCELLSQLFYRVRGLALQSCALYQGDSLKRSEKDISQDIQNAINSVALT